MTFSIAARCPRTGQLGVAVSTKLMCVGALVPFVRAGVGAVATQSFVNPYIGTWGLRYLEQGIGAPDAVDRLAADDTGRDVRQFSVVGADGRAASYSGANCVNWFGHQVGDGYAAAGNMLVGAETVAEMANAFEASVGEELAERLVRAVEAGQAAGGDKRGRQSAALYVVAEEDYGLVDLRVDDNPDPVAELRRLWNLYLAELRPIMGMLPRKANLAGTFTAAEVAAYLPRD